MPSDVLAVLWFDTEDFVTPESDQSALRIAQTLDEHGVKATFKIVGEKLRGFQERKRTDIIEALAGHDIGYHTDLHSIHPMIQEYVGNKSWDEGMAEIEHRERKGFELLKKVFKRNPSCYGQPGLAWVPQMYPVLKKWGVQVYLDDAVSIETLNERPFWYCNVLNLMCLRSNVLTLDASDGPANVPPDGLVKLREEFVRTYNKLAAEDDTGIISVYCHPTTYSTWQFWDMLNFTGGKNRTGGYLKPRLKTERESEEDYANLGKLLSVAGSLPGLRFMTSADAIRIYPDRAVGREFSAAEIEELCKRSAAAINYQRLEKDIVVSAAEVFTLVLQSLADFSASGKLSPQAEILQPFGPKDKPGRVSKSVTVTLDEFLRASAGTLKEIKRTGYIPRSIRLGKKSTISPADMFATSCWVYLALSRGKPPAKKFATKSGKFEVGKMVSEKGAQVEWSYYLNKKGFKTPRQTELARLQTWTIKPAIADPEAVSALPNVSASS